MKRDWEKARRRDKEREARRYDPIASFKPSKRRRRFKPHRRRRAFAVQTPYERPPTVERLLRIEAPYFVAGAIFRRRDVHWRCIKAAPIIEWMTRVNHVDVIHNWLKTKGFSYQWLNATTDQTAKLNWSEEQPVVLKKRSTAPSLNNDTQAASTHGADVASCLEQNGLITPRCLIAPECSGEDSDRLESC